MTQQIVTALQVKLTAESKNGGAAPSPTILQPMTTTGAGWISVPLHEKANVQARQMYAKAVELDPQFAAAYACLGFAYFDQWSLGWSQDPQTLEQAFALAQQSHRVDRLFTRRPPAIGHSLSVEKTTRAGGRRSGAGSCP